MKPITSTAHLSDDQIEDALIGDLAADCAVHLADCNECQLRLAEAEAPIAGFNAVSLAWSERRSATMPAKPAASASGAGLPRAAWAATAAAVLAVGIAVPLVHLAGNPKTVASAHGPAEATMMASTGPVENPLAARDEQIARDNQMLENIDREMEAPVGSAAQDFDLQTVSQHTAPRAAPASLRN